MEEVFLNQKIKKKKVDWPLKIMQWQKSGLSKREFVRREQLSGSSFSYNYGRLAKKNTRRFVFSKVKIIDKNLGQKVLKINFPNGSSLYLNDLSELKELLS